MGKYLRRAAAVFSGSRTLKQMETDPPNSDNNNLKRFISRHQQSSDR